MIELERFEARSKAYRAGLWKAGQSVVFTTVMPANAQLTARCYCWSQPALL